MSKKNSVDTKSPDAFQVGMYKFLEWAAKSKGLIIGITLPIVLLVFGFWGWQQFSNSQAESRRYELAKIDDDYATESESIADSRDEIQKQISDLSKTEKDRKANEAKIEKLESQINELKADHSKSLAAYKEFFSANSASVEGLRAGVAAANIEVANKNYEAARDILGKVLVNDTGVTFYDVEVRLLYANLLEESGAKDEALVQIDKVLTVSMDSVKPKVLFHKGRILWQQGKKEEADTVFTELSQKYATSQEARKISALKLILN